MRKNNNTVSEYSIKNIIPDYINFILVLIFGVIFHQKGTDITLFFLMQIGMLVICVGLTVIYYLFKAHITSKKNITSYSFLDYYSCIISYSVGTLFFIGLSVFLYKLLTFNFPINLVCFPSVLYANKEILKNLKQNPSNVFYLFIKVFMIGSCVPLLLVIPEIFQDIGLADAISFLICYSALCFPYKGTFNLLFSSKSKKKIYAFFSNPVKLFGLAYTSFSLILLLIGCCTYWRDGETFFIWFTIPFSCAGMIMLFKGK